jgi:hypothetical protein
MTLLLQVTYNVSDVNPIVLILIESVFNVGNSLLSLTSIVYVEYVFDGTLNENIDELDEGSSLT